MKTEKEFQDKLKKILRRARRRQWVMTLVRQMGLSANLYFAYERGELSITAYHLYKFMQMTGHDPEFIKQIFDDNWNPPSLHKPRIPDDR